MRIVQRSKSDPTCLELSWMWLPTFIGQNVALLKDLDKAMSKEFPPPLELDDVVLDKIHDFAVSWIQEKLKIAGLDQYLHAARYVDRTLPEIIQEMSVLLSRLRGQED